MLLLDNIPDDVMKSIVKSIDHVNALVNYYSTTKIKRSNITCKSTFMSLLQQLLNTNLEKLPKTVRVVLSTLPDLKSFRVTRTFWSNYMSGLVKAGLLDGTFAEAWHMAYKLNVEFYEQFPERADWRAEVDAEQALWGACKPLNRMIENIPSNAHATVLFRFVEYMIDKNYQRSLEDFRGIYNGNGQPASHRRRNIRGDTQEHMEMLEGLSGKRPKR